MNNDNTLPITHKGVSRALAWLGCEHMLCTNEELRAEFERMFSCKFSEDGQTIIFCDEKFFFWFKTKWR
jgi:hypothetical protein